MAKVLKQNAPPKGESPKNKTGKGDGKTAPPPRKTIARNKKAYFDYHVEHDMEAGISLLGSEVKACRRGDVSIEESFIHITPRNEAQWVNGYIKEFREANLQNHEPRRTRKLLLHKSEIEKINAYIRRKGFTALPLEIYFVGARLKLKVGLCKGKKEYDKRNVMKDKEARREMDRVVKKYAAR